MVCVHYRLHTNTPRTLLHWDVAVDAAALGVGGATRGECVTLTAFVTSVSGKGLSPSWRCVPTSGGAQGRAGYGTQCPGLVTRWGSVQRFRGPFQSK